MTRRFSGCVSTTRMRCGMRTPWQEASAASWPIRVHARRCFYATGKTSGKSGKFPNSCFHLIARSLEPSSLLGRISRETAMNWLPDNAKGGFAMDAIRAVVHVVDEDAEVRETLRAILEPDGYDVRCHGSASDFLKQWPMGGPGCVL